MQPEAYAAIQLECFKISNQKHRFLIYDYLSNSKSEEYEGWMDFHRSHFKIEERTELIMA